MEADMSDSLPKPLPSITALRAHLKLLERGVNDARTRRVGPSTPPTPPAPAARPIIAEPRATAPTASTHQGSFRLPAAQAAEQASGKPKAKAKSVTDFSAFFDGVQQQRAAS
jgi:hypothetical protein